MVAFNSRGSGAENQPVTFFSQELLPTDSPQNVMFDRSGEYINISWDALSLSEARGFPVYTVMLTPSTSNDGQQITDGIIVVNTNESSIVVGGLDVNIGYTLTVAVGTTAGQIMSDGGTHIIANCPLMPRFIVHRPMNSIFCQYYVYRELQKFKGKSQFTISYLFTALYNKHFHFAFLT